MAIEKRAFLKFKKLLADKLLDLTGRSTLIKAKLDNGNKRLAFVGADPLEVLRFLENSGEPVSFKAVPNQDSTPLDEKSPEFERELNELRLSEKALAKAQPKKLWFGRARSRSVENEMKDKVRKILGLSPIDRESQVKVERVA